LWGQWGVSVYTCNLPKPFSSLCHPLPFISYLSLSYTPSSSILISSSHLPTALWYPLTHLFILSAVCHSINLFVNHDRNGSYFGK
jgi:hypothetical protein